MYAAVLGCLFVLIVADGAALWKAFHAQSFLTAYLAVSHPSTLSFVAPRRHICIYMTK